MAASPMAAHDDLLAATCLGIAFVIESRFIRGFVATIFWISQQHVPHTVHSSRADALAHAIRECQRRGMSLPAAALREDAADLVDRALRDHLHARVA